MRQRRTVVKRRGATQRSEYGGFGSQFQNIIQAAVYAEWHKKHFCVNPLTAVDHNYDNRDTFLREVIAIATLDLPRLPPQLYYCLFVQSRPSNDDVTLEFIENKKRWFDEFFEEKKHADFAKQHDYNYVNVLFIQLWKYSIFGVSVSVHYTCAKSISDAADAPGAAVESASDGGGGGGGNLEISRLQDSLKMSSFCPGPGESSHG